MSDDQLERFAEVVLGAMDYSTCSLKLAENYGRIAAQVAFATANELDTLLFQAMNPQEQEDDE